MSDYSKNVQTLIYLLSCAVNEKECELDPAEVDFDGLYTLAKNQGVCSAVAVALESAGIKDERFTQARLKAKRKLALFDIEREKVYQRLNAAGIWYLPLKGIILKDFYPKYGMREMSDNDILCDSSRMSDVKELMESLGYNCGYYSKGNHDIYQKPPTIEFEMHRRLFSADESPVLEDYYADVFTRLIQKAGCEYAFSDEGFYSYMLAHAYKHFSHFGTGLRSLLDAYVFLQTHPDLDFDSITREMEELQMTAFEQRFRDVAVKLFSFRQLDAEDIEFLALFLDSTLYGSVSKAFYNRLTRQLDGSDAKSAKMKYFFDRVFLRGDVLERSYPFFAKHKWLLPALYVYRPFKGLFTHPKSIVRDTKAVMKYKPPKHRW